MLEFGGLRLNRFLLNRYFKNLNYEEANHHFKDLNYEEANHHGRTFSQGIRL